MARQTIRTTSLLARGASTETPNVAETVIDEPIPEVVDDGDDAAAHVAPTSNVTALPSPIRSRRRLAAASQPAAEPPADPAPASQPASQPAAQQPVTGPASPMSAAAKGRRGRKPKAAGVAAPGEVTSADLLVYGKLAHTAMHRGVTIDELVAEYQEAITVHAKMKAAIAV